jgi:hypothetical protein
MMNVSNVEAVPPTQIPKQIKQLWRMRGAETNYAIVADVGCCNDNFVQPDFAPMPMVCSNSG